MPRTENYLSTLREMIRTYEFKGSHTSFLLRLKAFIDTNYKRPAPVYCQVKKIIEKECDDKSLKVLARAVLRETPSQKLRSDAMKQQALIKRNETVTVFKYDYVLHVIKTCAAMGDPLDRFIALQVAVGCRQRDLFDAELCSFHKGSDAYSVIQHGSSKKREGAPPFVLEKKTVGLDGEAFLTILKLFRHALAADPRDVVAKTSYWNSALCERTRQFFPIRQKRSGTHVNRALYSACVRFLSRGYRSGPREVQLSLGHSNMTTALHYLYIDVAAEGYDGRQ
jgi:hypothetical protein